MSDQIDWKARVEEMKRRAVANDYAALLSRITELEAEPDWKARALKAESKLTRLVEACRPFLRHWESWMDEHAADTQVSVFSRHTFGELRCLRTLSEALEGGDEMASVAKAPK